MIIKLFDNNIWSLDKIEDSVNQRIKIIAGHPPQRIASDNISAASADRTRFCATSMRGIIIPRLLVINAGHFAAAVQVIKSGRSMNYVMNQGGEVAGGRKKSREKLLCKTTTANSKIPIIIRTLVALYARLPAADLLCLRFMRATRNNDPRVNTLEVKSKLFALLITHARNN